MKRTQSAIAALGVALAVFATGWAIGVNSGIFSDGPRHEPVSARIEVTETAVPSYGVVSQGATDTADPGWYEDRDQVREHDDDDDHDDWEEHESREERGHKEPRDRDREEHHDDD